MGDIGPAARAGEDRVAREQRDVLVELEVACDVDVNDKKTAAMASKQRLLNRMCWGANNRLRGAGTKHTRNLGTPN